LHCVRLDAARQTRLRGAVPPCGRKRFDNLVIMTTAKAQDIDSKLMPYKFGVSDYITKPFNMDVLVCDDRSESKK